MTRVQEHSHHGLLARLRWFKAAMERTFRPRVLSLVVEDAVLLEGAITVVRWRTSGTLFTHVKGYGRCRRHGTMHTVLTAPALQLEITAYGPFGKDTVHVLHPVHPVHLRVPSLRAKSFHTHVNSPVPALIATNAIRSAELGYARPVLAFKLGHPVIHGPMPHHVDIEEPEPDHHHAVQGLLNA